MHPSRSTVERDGRHRSRSPSRSRRNPSDRYHQRGRNNSPESSSRHRRSPRHGYSRRSPTYGSSHRSRYDRHDRDYRDRRRSRSRRDSSSRRSRSPRQRYDRRNTHRDSPERGYRKRTPERTGQNNNDTQSRDEQRMQVQMMAEQHAMARELEEMRQCESAMQEANKAGDAPPYFPARQPHRGPTTPPELDPHLGSPMRLCSASPSPEVSRRLQQAIPGPPQYQNPGPSPASHYDLNLSTIPHEQQYYNNGQLQQQPYPLHDNMFDPRAPCQYPTPDAFPGRGYPHPSGMAPSYQMPWNLQPQHLGRSQGTAWSANNTEPDQQRSLVSEVPLPPSAPYQFQPGAAGQNQDPPTSLHQQQPGISSLIPPASSADTVQQIKLAATRPVPPPPPSRDTALGDAYDPERDTVTPGRSTDHGLHPAALDVPSKANDVPSLTEPPGVCFATAPALLGGQHESVGGRYQRMSPTGDWDIFTAVPVTETTGSNDLMTRVTSATSAEGRLMSPEARERANQWAFPGILIQDSTTQHFCWTDEISNNQILCGAKPEETEAYMSGSGDLSLLPYFFHNSQTGCIHRVTWVTPQLAPDPTPTMNETSPKEGEDVATKQELSMLKKEVEELRSELALRRQKEELESAAGNLIPEHSIQQPITEVIAPDVSSSLLHYPLDPHGNNWLPPGWKSAVDKDGDTYYYHCDNRQTQWELPEWSKEELQLAGLAPLTHNIPPAPRPMPRGSAKERPRSGTTIEVCDISSSSSQGKATVHTTTAAADTSSEVAKRLRETFKSQMSGRVIKYLSSYRKMSCKLGRIESNEDFKYLARKLTHAILEKEMKSKAVEDLKVTEHVVNKAKIYIHSYMSKSGPVFKRRE